MVTPIGTDARISIADLAGEFVELEPLQRRVSDLIEASGHRVVVVGTNDHWPAAAALAGTRGDRIVIDDPWAERDEPIDIDVATRMFLDGLPPLADGTDPVIIMSRLYDEPALKLAEAQRFEQLEYRKLRAAELAQPIGSGNRADRRAKAARRRKARR